MRALHERYGPVVRVAPGELSFCSVKSWQDIYGARVGHSPLVKSTFYEGGSFANEASSIVSERDETKHRDMRKYLSTAFSERSLKEQEYLIAKVMDRFIHGVGEEEGHAKDMTTWFNLLTFDIIGELAFGQSFGGVESGKMHFWVAVVVSSLRQNSLSDTIMRFPLLGKVFMTLNPGWLTRLMEGARRHEAYTMEMVQRYDHCMKHDGLSLTVRVRRINERTERKDFMTNLLKSKDREQYNISTIQLAAHASDFVYRCQCQYEMPLLMPA